ncbi:hypothetical protein TNCV_3040741, partial [Trichonephila clavipes]
DGNAHGRKAEARIPVGMTTVSEIARALVPEMSPNNLKLESVSRLSNPRWNTFVFFLPFYVASRVKKEGIWRERALGVQHGSSSRGKSKYIGIQLT